MDIKLIIFLITLTYIGYYVVSKIALRHYTEKTIIVNVYLICAIIVFFLYNKELHISISNININYLWIILLAIIVITTNICLLYACNTKYNFGSVDGMAIALYLPIVSIISYYYFKNSVTPINFLGIILVGIGGYLINSTL